MALLVYFLVVSRYMREMDLLDRRIARKTEELEEVLTLQRQYTRLKEKAEILEDMVHSTPGFSLLSFLENLATQNRIKTQIAYMKPLTTPGNETYKESSVEMKLESITLQQLVNYLYQVERSSQPIRIKRLNIAKKKEKAYLDVTLQASTFEPREGSGGPRREKAKATGMR